MPEAIKKFYHQQKWALTIAAIILVSFFVIRALILHFSHKKAVAPPVSVGVANVQTRDVPVYFSALGTVNPVQTITVKTQINGTLMHVYFKDGQYVKAGQLLAQIDPRPYEAQLLQFQGQLIRDQALLDNALIDLKRYQNLYQSRAVSEQTLATQVSLVKQDEGTVKIDQGQIDAVKTNLIYCKITSPVTGRIGIGIVNQGNFVQTSDTTGIAVITTLNPMYIVFALPEDDLSSIVTPFNAGKKLTVFAYDRDQEKLLATGSLFAIDNQVNTSTGTVNFKAEYSNKNNILFPNQFVNIKLKVTTLKNALVIPTAAVQEGTQGPYVYRYNANHTVNNIAVKTGVQDGLDTVITSGLSANQTVVTEGTDKLFDGARVNVAGSTQ